MDNIEVEFTVLFEAPFWIGIYECKYVNGYEINKITFGAEPKACEIYELILKRWNEIKSNLIIEKQVIDKKHINPKRMQRAIKKQVGSSGIGRKAQQVLKLQQEQGKIERKLRSREQKEAEKERRFELRQQKHREKHKGH